MTKKFENHYIEKPYQEFSSHIFHVQYTILWIANFLL